MAAENEKEYSWWMPPPWREAALVLDKDGKMKPIGIRIPSNIVNCDICNASVNYRPVGLILDDYAACPKHFQKKTGMTPEEAAAQDGFELTYLSEDELSRAEVEQIVEDALTSDFFGGK